MGNTYLIVIDMQNDFVSGSLGTEEARKIAERVISKVKNFKGNVIFTLDTHEEDYLETQEGKLLPVRHGIEGSEGWHLIRELDEVQKEKGFPVYRKNMFASRKLAEDLYDINSKHPIKSIEIIGLCTDICVVSNALMIKGFLPEVPIKVDSSCCAGVTAERHESALKTMESCQISVIQED